MNLKTRYLTLNLESPFIASASPLTGKIDSLKALEDAGAAAVVLPSLFEEELRHDHQRLDIFSAQGADATAEARSYLPNADLYRRAGHRTLDLIQQAKDALQIPVIASINGITADGWSYIAKDMQEAGADALELNLYHIGNDPDRSGAVIEAELATVVSQVRATVRLPLAVKVSPWFTSFAHMARHLHEAGADALVLFNRFYQPDIDPDALSLSRRLSLSDSRDLLLPMSWIAMLRPRLRCDFALTSGIHSAEDAVKALMAGADALMMTSALLKHGPARLQEIRANLLAWMEQKGYQGIHELRGCMRRDRVPNPDLFERTNYLRLLDSWEA